MNIMEAVNSLGTDYVKSATSAVNNSSGLASQENDSTSFDSVFNAVSGLLNSTNDYVQEAQRAEIDFALGNITSTHELGVYQQKANIALQYTVAVRDKVLEAYKEIMNMQI